MDLDSHSWVDYKFSNISKPHFINICSKDILTSQEALWHKVTPHVEVQSHDSRIRKPDVNDIINMKTRYHMGYLLSTSNQLNISSSTARTDSKDVYRPELDLGLAPLRRIVDQMNNLQKGTSKAEKNESFGKYRAGLPSYCDYLQNNDYKKTTIQKPLKTYHNQKNRSKNKSNRIDR
eukprot:gene4699-6599_t